MSFLSTRIENRGREGEKEWVCVCMRERERERERKRGGFPPASLSLFIAYLLKKRHNDTHTQSPHTHILKRPIDFLSLQKLFRIDSGKVLVELRLNLIDAFHNNSINLDETKTIFKWKKNRTTDQFNKGCQSVNIEIVNKFISTKALLRSSILVKKIE